MVVCRHYSASYNPLDTCGNLTGPCYLELIGNSGLSVWSRIPFSHFINYRKMIFPERPWEKWTRGHGPTHPQATGETLLRTLYTSWRLPTFSNKSSVILFVCFRRIRQHFWQVDGQVQKSLATAWQNTCAFYCKSNWALWPSIRTCTQRLATLHNTRALMLSEFPERTCCSLRQNTAFMRTKHVYIVFPLTLNNKKLLSSPAQGESFCPGHLSIDLLCRWSKPLKSCAR